ncbi:hypothetical protein ES332_A05G343700v1 [Gossypium tomentosum]|uniref:Uncharacterized protein n=1 Tax=Gossypium tomentosum TaxID=34277 RepID=A0A5D2QNZ8_GOSTO|nr:hypothetical protein ES332_A05G343700v1 [Gossypium tomentosum]TYI29823.1 hypothetical protein ES332_A05G343700v1 [Gossypium tomentosum]TYI29824.1 hypothetical protein ES332_A05G343700v1 [Gossypium tomentosum]
MDLDDGNGNIEYSRTDIEETDGIGSNKQSGEYQGLFARNQSRNGRHGTVEKGTNKHATRHLELDDESGSSKHSSKVINGVAGIGSNHFETNPEVYKGWGDNHNFEILGDSSKQSKVIQGKKDWIEGNIHISAEKRSLSSSSPSTSSSSLSTDDQFEVDINLSKTKSGPKSEEKATQIQSLKDKHHVSNGDASLALASQVSCGTNEPTLMQSPLVQVMDRVGGLDSCKISSAVFARSKSITPMDWSLPSSESLFSIQLGDNSFSRDYVLSSKSRELFKSGEFVELSPLAIVLEGDTVKKGVESDKSEPTSISDDVVKDKTGRSIEGQVIEKPASPMVSWSSDTTAHHSVDNVSSVHSMDFPIRKKTQRKCGWPSCYCSNCWLAVCYGWKCTILSDGKCASAIEKEQKQQQQQQQKEHPMASSVPSKSSCCTCSSC